MKRYILISILLLSLAGCEIVRTGKRTGYIGTYVYFNPDKAILTYDNGGCSMLLEPAYMNVYVNSYNFVFNSNPSLEERYYALCEKFGDIKPDGFTCSSYNHLPYPIAYFEIVNTIAITSNADWNADHPAGTSLNDLFDITYHTYYPYVSNRYVGEELTTVTKPLTELQYDEMKLIQLDISLMCSSLPTEFEHHTLTISFELDTDRTATYEVELDFSVTTNPI